MSNMPTDLKVAILGTVLFSSDFRIIKVENPNSKQNRMLIGMDREKNISKTGQFTYENTECPKETGKLALYHRANMKRTGCSSTANSEGLKSPVQLRKRKAS